MRLKKENEMTYKKKCCLCGDTIVGWGHNPEPLRNGTELPNRCCGVCNDTKVVPTRIILMMGAK